MFIIQTENEDKFDNTFDNTFLVFIGIFWYFLDLQNLNFGHEKTAETIDITGFQRFGGGRWIRTTEVTDNRFTVCKKHRKINDFLKS